MTDQMKNGPINIPIESDDDLESAAGAAADDDVIEIDADADDFDEDLSSLEEDADEAAAAPPAPEPAPVDEPFDSELEPEPLTGVEEAVEAGEFEFAPSGAEPAAAAPEAFDPEVEPAGGPARAEISREAVFLLMQELRGKSEQVARLTDQNNELMDRLRRKQAEFENFRKRGERENAEAYVRARADLVGELLPIIDNFDLALHHADNANPEVILEGVQLIYKQLMDTLGRLGLDPIEAEGQPFDPELHDAVATETNEEVPDHTVVMVLQRGFKLGDRMLRPARVKVAVQP
jgi:molecular chaperone GrpE